MAKDSDYIQALDFTKSDSRLFCTVGCHPTRCNEFEQKESENYLNELISVAIEGAKCGKVVAVGECGLVCLLYNKHKGILSHICYILGL